MYNNLRAEMTRSNVSVQGIADLLGKTARTVRDKLMGRSDFTIGEFTKIHDTFFSDLSLAYLSEKTETVEEADPPDAAEESAERNHMPEQKVQTNPVKVIREKCIDCCCGNMAEVARCAAEKCPLHPWRMGKNPYRKPPSEAQLEAARKRAEEINQQRAAVVDSET